MDLSFQLYSARNVQPWADVLERIAGIGYRQVEGFGGAYADPAGLRAALDCNGLIMPSAHFSLDMLADDFESARRIASVLGVSTLVAPYLQPAERPSDARGWRGLGETLAEIGRQAADEGYRFAWHNHDFEFAPLDDGSVPLRLILEAADGVGLELDVAWAVRAGADPLPWIAELGPRILLVHLKDLAPAGENAGEDGWADLGHGIVNWRPVMAAIRKETQADIFVVEHDNPADLDRFALRSFEAAQAL